MLLLLLLVGVAACGGAPPTQATPRDATASREAGTPLSTGEGPTGLAAHEQVLLVTHASGSVVAVTAGGDVEPLSEQAHGLTAPVVAFGSLWAAQTGAGGTDVTEDADGTSANYSLDGLVRIDPSDGTTLATIGDLGTGLVLAETGDALWVAGERAGEQGWVWRIDPDTDTATVIQPGDGVSGDRGVRTSALIVADERLWLIGNCEPMPCRTAAARIQVIDPASSEVTPVDIALPKELLVSAAAGADDRVWLAGLSFGQQGEFEQPQGLLVAVESTGEVVHQLEVGRLPSGLALGDDGLWMTDCLAGTLTRLDHDSGEIIAEPIVVGAAYPPDEPYDWYSEDHACPGPLARIGNTIWVALLHDFTVIPVR